MTIAIIGTHGLVAPAIIETLKDPKFNKQPLILVPRDTAGKTSEPASHDSPAIEYIAFDDLDKAVAKADILIAVHPPNPTIYEAVYKALASPDNKVKLYFSASFGFYDKQVASYLPGVVPFRPAHIEAVRKLGIKTVAAHTGLFAIPKGFLYEFALSAVGYNVEAGKVRYIGTGDEKVNVSNPTDIARSVAALIGKPHSEIPDDFVIYSDTVTPKQVVKQYTDRHSVKVEVEHADIAATTQYVKEHINSLNFVSEVLPTILANGLDKGLLQSSSHRELVNPGESLWKWHKY